MTPDNKIAKKNALVLACCQSLNGIIAMTVITTGGLLGFSFADNKAYATMPVAFFNLGSWLTSYPAAKFMQKYGRQNGFRLGAMMGLLGSLIVFYAILQRDFLLLTLGSTLIGSFHGFSQQYRFAATDMATEEFKPKAISRVLMGGIVAALIGGPLITASKMAYGGILFAGCFLILALCSILVFALLSKIDIPSLAPEKKKIIHRSRREIFSEPKLMVGIICGMITYGLMSLVMTASPLAMHACGHAVDDATTVIQWHVLGMFLPSLFCGALITRFGVRPIMISGFLFLLVSAFIAMAGTTFWHFWLALIFLGVGWNFGFIGSTSLVASASRPDERGIVQGTNDMLVLGTVTFASFMSGQLLDGVGWNFVNILVFPLCTTAIISLLWLSSKEKGLTPIK